jgi:polar amino acid transport system substrate-binding protein
VRWIEVAAAVALLAPALAGEAVAQRDIRIATEGAYPPFNYVDQNEPAGFEVDLGRALCEAMSASCTFLIQDWEGMIPGLKEGKFDAIMSSMEITPERAHRIAFSKAYYRIPSALIGLKDADFQGATPEKLEGRSIGTTPDSEFEAFLETGYKNSTIRTFDKIEEAELDLLTGRIDYVLGDKLALAKFLDSREGRTCCKFLADMPVDRGEGIGIGLRKTDQDLVGAFNTAIDKVIGDGTYGRIRVKYFPFAIRPNSETGFSPSPKSP